MNELTDLQIAARRHRDLDMLYATTLGMMERGKFKGGSIGCMVYDHQPEISLNGGNEIHAIASRIFGAPEWWFLMQDSIFEGLPEEDRANWHVRCADAISEFKGDWGLALHRVHAAILSVSLKNAGNAESEVKAVIELHQAASRGEHIDAAAWSAAWSAALAAAWSAALAAALAAAESAAWSAAWSAARSAAWSAAYKSISKKVIAALLDQDAAS